MCFSTRQIQNGILVRTMSEECNKSISNSKSETVMRLPGWVICIWRFGNDISMFQMADEAYATKNAIDELKEIDYRNH